MARLSVTGGCRCREPSVVPPSTNRRLRSTRGATEPSSGRSREPVESVRVVRHQLVCAEDHQLASKYGLKSDKTVGPAKLEDPVEAAAARREAVALCCDDDRQRLAMTSRDHRAQRIYLGVDIMGSETVFDVAADEDGSVIREDGCSYASVAMHACMRTHPPGGLREIEPAPARLVYELLGAIGITGRGGHIRRTAQGGLASGLRLWHSSAPP